MGLHSVDTRIPPPRFQTKRSPSFMKRFPKTKRNSFFLPSSDVTLLQPLLSSPLSEGEIFLGLPSNREPFLPASGKWHVNYGVPVPNWDVPLHQNFKNQEPK
ncbi:hypothetical protein TNCV_109591 [Trichonephila clavipes]|nr:hypothetical protein TNCV_109591 [Trichonephila clavipes]